MCIGGSRRGSGESYYQELEEEDPVSLTVPKESIPASRGGVDGVDDFQPSQISREFREMGIFFCSHLGIEILVLTCWFGLSRSSRSPTNP